MRLIKNSPEFNEQWPRAVVPYRQIYGVDEPAIVPPLANDGSIDDRLPAGTPFGLIGSSSLYKRESYPDGKVPAGSVTAGFAGEHDRNGYEGLDPFNTSQNGASLNWFNQGADAGRYDNFDIYALRILAMEPTTHRHRGTYPKDGRRFASHAQERLRILGEFPVRKPDAEGREPRDPDGNPDTSFLARIPADTAFTFQTLDREGMLLNMSQTWHHLRPGEMRVNCGGCHAHSQKPTPFELTAAARPDYKLWDLTTQTPLLTKVRTIRSEATGEAERSALRHVNRGVLNVEYFRDVQPILKRSCVACHSKNREKPAGNLVLDADDEQVQAGHQGKFPGTYYRLAMDSKAKFGHPPVIHNGTWRNQNASRYIRKFQSRRSLLIWKIYGKRLDGWENDDFPTAIRPGDPDSLALNGKRIENTRHNRDRSDLDYNGKPMPPPEAVAGTWTDESGQKVKVQGLSAEDRLTLVRWIDLGCPVDFDFDSANPERRGYGWACDDNRPVLALPLPRPGRNPPLTELRIGLFDYDTGIDPESLLVQADFELDGHAPGTNLASQFQPVGKSIWRWTFQSPLGELGEGTLSVSVRDQSGNITERVRTFSIGIDPVR